jgi:hypothetical protein
VGAVLSSLIRPPYDHPHHDAVAKVSPRRRSFNITHSANLAATHDALDVRRIQEGAPTSRRIGMQHRNTTY